MRNTIGDQRAEALMPSMLDQAAVGVALAGLDTTVRWVNPALAALLGRSEVELRDLPLSDLTHPDDRDVDSDHARRLTAGDIPAYRIEKRFVHTDGSPVWCDVAVTLQRAAEGTPSSLVVIVFDITARKQAEARLEAALASIDDHLVSYDSQWRYTFVNEGAARVLGMQKEDLLGRCIWELFPGAVGNQYYRELHQARAEQRVIRSTHYYAPFEKWFENYMYPTPDGVTVFATDVTWRMRLEEELHKQNTRLAEADRLKDEFVAVLAHELRNPLAPVRNALEVMRMPGAPAAMVEQVRGIAERQVQHMARLLDDLLDVSRITSGRIELRREWVDVASIVARTMDAVRPLIEAQQQEASVSLAPGPMLVEADPTRLEQVLTNLVHNAAKYTPPGGQIAVSAEYGGNDLILRVRDSGIGIDPDMLPKIFDLFVQADRGADRSQSGVGIGLTLVKKLVELHGGTVEAQSAGRGQGSEFIVRLNAPAEARVRGAQGGTTPATHPTLPRNRVLVADDNRDAADSFSMLLKLMGQEVRTGYDGASALSMAKDFGPTHAFLDLGMPDIDGYEVGRRLRADPALAGMVLVALTGWGQEEDRRRSAEAGFDHHLVKPVSFDALERVLAAGAPPRLAQ